MMKGSFLSWCWVAIFAAILANPGRVEAVDFPFFDGFETGLGNWTALGTLGNWNLTGVEARSGSLSATDSPAGDYLDNSNGWLELKTSIDLSSSISPVLTFWEKVAVWNGDPVLVEVSEDGGTSWVSVSTRQNIAINTWSPVQIDLSTYKNVPIKIRFRLSANGDGFVRRGWSIDDVEIKERDDCALLPFPFLDTFENGLDNWVVSGHDWDRDTSDFRSTGHSLMDSPLDDYPNYANATAMLSCTIDLSSSVLPVLTFWEKVAVWNGDPVLVEVSEDGGTSWVSVSTRQNIAINDWSFVPIDLSAYKSVPIKIRFRLRANGDGFVRGGWSIDDVRIKELVGDTDGDMIPDDDDNCTDISNAMQDDVNHDGVGDICDCDFNDDEFCGGPDFSIFVGCFNAASEIGTVCETTDMNGDGFVGGVDFTFFIGGFNSPPGPAAPWPPQLIAP
jgi:hypothetical protein